MNAAGYIDVASCRLFPRRTDIRYEGLVHELPNPALERAGINIQGTSFLVHHYGHLVGEERRDVKNSRYAMLLRKKLRVNPDDPQARYEMAVQLVREGQTKLARSLLTRTVAEMPEHQAVYQARLLLGHLLLAAGQPDAGTAQLEAAVRDWPALRPGWLVTSRAHAELGHRSVAARYLAQARWLFPGDAQLQGLADRVASGGRV